MNSYIRRPIAILLFFVLCLPALAADRKLPKPGFNLFSKEQDVQIGKEGMQEIESKYKIVTNKEVNEFIQRIGQKLASTPEAAEYPYTFKVVLDDSINAFALPGGPTYVNTGLILAADNEAQIAGVMGHEIAHVALRHGTNQASKGSLLQLGAMLGGSMVGGGSITGQLAQLGIGFGANSVLMKFSRGAESDADILGVHMMGRVGYNPIEAARFFEKLEAEGGNRGKVAEFFSSHPNPGNRTQRIEQEIQYLPKREYDAPSGQLARVQEIVRGLDPANDVQSGASRQQPSAQIPGEGQPGAIPQISRPEQITLPARQHQQYQGREFALTFPENWRAYDDGSGGSVTFAPEDGVVGGASGSAVVRGVIAATVPSPGGGSVDLERDTEALIQQLLQSNPGLKRADRPARQVRVDNGTGLLTTLYSQSPYEGETELDMLLTVARPNGLFYAVFVAPQQEFRQQQPAFDKILRSIRFIN